MQRFGRRNRPFYRIAAIDHRKRREGLVIEQLGWFDPLAKDPAKQVSLNEERIRYWLGVGARPSDTMRDMLAKRNLVDVAAWEADRARRRKAVEARLAAAPKAEPENKDQKA